MSGTLGHDSGARCQAHKTYSLNCEEYEELWARAAGKCEACRQTLGRGRGDHVIDHDHRYGAEAVRGIICKRCNWYLARLETPRVHPAFGRGPGRWFAGYLNRAWFMRRRRPEPDVGGAVDYDRLTPELRSWETHNKQLFTRDAKAVVVPTDKPAEIAKILREAMSPQAFGSLVRQVNAEAATPKAVKEAA